jgi:hypothetical protein
VINMEITALVDMTPCVLLELYYSDHKRGVGYENSEIKYNTAFGIKQ